MENFHGLIKQQSVLEQLKKIGIQSPTTIQENVIPELLKGESILATAKTGSGKTLAFVLPILEKIDSSDLSTQALVLCPTRELALQVSSVFEVFCTDLNIKLLTLYGGQARTKQLNKLIEQPQIIVATAGRLLDFLDSKEVSLEKLRTLIIDEADQMLLYGFQNEMGKLLKFVPKTIQIGCFSATMDSKVKKMAYRFSDTFQEVDADEEPNQLPNRFIHVSDRWKRLALTHLFQRENPFMAIIFCRTIRRAEELHAHLISEGYTCAITHGDLSQNVRQRTLKQFRELKYQYLISTDLSSRGIDIPGITHIFNYDFPENVETFIHRIGRTARMGKEGVAFSLVTPKDEPLFEQIKKALITPFEEEEFDRNAL